METAVDTISSASPLQRARDLVLSELTVRRCAAWCGVKENTVYQWLGRGTDVEPIPVSWAMRIARAARAEGLACDIRVLVPSLPEGLA